jgi:hypothetical protein
MAALGGKWCGQPTVTPDFQNKKIGGRHASQGHSEKSAWKRCGEGADMPLGHGKKRFEPEV